MVDVAIVVLMHHVMAMCLILLLFLNSLGLFKMSSCMHATPGVAKVSMPCRYHWHPWGGSGPRRVPNSFQVHRGSCDPRFTCSSNSEDSRFLLKSMWNIDFDDDTMVIPACVQFCLHSHTVAWWTYRGLNTYVYFCFLLFLLFLLLLIFCSCSCCCPCLLSLLLLCSSVLLCCIFLGCFYLYLLLLFFGCCALMVVCRFVWVCACYHAPDLCCHTLCLDPRCSALLHLNMNALSKCKKTNPTRF